MPTTHDQMVSQDRFILLYCILTGKSIDVGKCIKEELRFSAFTKKKGKLFFPSLISGLCLKAVETKVQNSTKIFAVAITRLSKPLSGSSSSGFKQAMSDINRRLDLQEHNQQQRKQILKHMKQEYHQVWKYIKEKDIALKKSLQRNFNKPMDQLRAFPDEVLKRWVESSSYDEEADEEEAEEEAEEEQEEEEQEKVFEQQPRWYLTRTRG